jgi:flagellar secretion chaperone FliS
VMFEQILAQLATAQGCMGRIKNNLPLADVVAKGKALGKAIRLIDQLNASLDMERGQKIAENLRALYVYMLARLTLANVTNDSVIVVEVSGLVQKIKTGWDQIVADGR